MCGFQGMQNPIRFPVTMAKGIHLFPYRTQKLSLSAPMVLGWRRPGRVGRCRIPQRKASDDVWGFFFVHPVRFFFQVVFNQCATLYLVRISSPAPCGRFSEMKAGIAKERTARLLRFPGWESRTLLNSMKSFALQPSGSWSLHVLDRHRIKIPEPQCV